MVIPDRDEKAVEVAEDDELKSKSLLVPTTPPPVLPPCSRSPPRSPALPTVREEGARNSIRFSGELVSETVISTVISTGPMLLKRRTTRQKYFVSLPFQSIDSLIRPEKGNNSGNQIIAQYFFFPFFICVEIQKGENSIKSHAHQPVYFCSNAIIPLKKPTRA